MDNGIMSYAIALPDLAGEPSIYLGQAVHGRRHREVELSSHRSPHHEAMRRGRSFYTSGSSPRSMHDFPPVVSWRFVFDTFLRLKPTKRVVEISFRSSYGFVRAPRHSTGRQPWTDIRRAAAW